MSQNNQTHQEDLALTRICVQEMLPDERHQYHAMMNQPGMAQGQLDRLRAAFWQAKLWPKGATITIGFLSDGRGVRKTPTPALKASGQGKIDPLQEEVNNTSIPEMIKKIVKERLQPLVNLQLTFVDDPRNATVRISFDPNGGAWSLVGTDNARQSTGATMNLGWFDVPTTIHEFGHVLGMIHEHQNPRGQTIEWNVPRVLTWARETQGWDASTTKRNIIDKYDTSMINGSSFDPLSIMLYFFQPDLTLNGVGTRQNLRLSGEDVEWINKMYPTDDTDVPKDFYRKVYGDSLSGSIAQSEKLAKDFGKPGSPGRYGPGVLDEDSAFSRSNILIAVVAVFLVLIVVLWLVGGKRKRNGRRG